MSYILDDIDEDDRWVADEMDAKDDIKEEEEE